MKRFGVVALCATMAGAVALPHPVSAAEEDFFRGKTMNLIIPMGPGGGYDTFGRLVSKHFGKFLPGNPTIVPRNMPGAGGTVASNYLYNISPHDGTTLTIITSSFASDQILGQAKASYDARKFLALGRLQSTRSVLFFWHEAPIKSAKDLWKMPSTIAASTLNALPAVRLTLMNSLLDTKMKLIPGYPSAQDFVLATERMEVDGAASTHLGLTQLFPAYVADKKLNIVLQFGAKRDPNLPDVPALSEFIQDAETKQLFNFTFSSDEIGRSLFTTPEVPPARLEVLRNVYQKMMADTAFLADVKQVNLSVDPASGEEIQNVVLDLFSTSTSAVEKIKELANKK